MKIILFLVFTHFYSTAWGHGGIDHSKGDSHAPVKMPPIGNRNSQIHQRINESYKLNVRPIFERSCFDCHSSTTQYPWYYKVPGVKQLIDSDIKEARSHLDFSHDFPFISHDSPENDLKSIQKSVEEENMPPFKYLILHSNSDLSDIEVKTISDWTQTSLNMLKNEPKSR